MSKLTKSEAGKIGYLKALPTIQRNAKERILQYQKSPNKCEHCGRELSYEKRHNKFCNQSCAASYNNKHKKRKEKFKCLNCGKSIDRGKKFCNNKCQMDYNYKEFINKWKNKEVDGVVGKCNISGHIKRYLFEKNHGQCELCGWHEVNPSTGNIPLEVHHKDGNYQNNDEGNLQLLCPNCHSLTSTYKALNKNGRKERNY